jgi:hypothetical protein
MRTPLAISEERSARGNVAQTDCFGEGGAHLLRSCCDVSGPLGIHDYADQISRG